MKKLKLKSSELKLRIIYRCTVCKWETSILQAWQDLKPKKCRSCKISFILDPDKLKIIKPILKTEVSQQTNKKQKKKSSNTKSDE